MSHADKHQTFVDIVINKNGLIEFNTWQGIEGQDFKKTDSWTDTVPVGGALHAKR